MAAFSQSTVRLIRVAFVVALSIITYATITPQDHMLAGTINDKLGHITAFLLLAFLADFSFPNEGFGWSKTLPLLSYGLLIEIIQYLLPYRMFSLLDLAADATGLIVYAWLLPALRYVPALKSRWESAEKL